MNPTAGDLHVNVPLTNISVAFAQGQDQYIADKVFPNIPVTAKTNTYWVYDRSDWMRIEAEERPPSTESAGSGWTVSTDDYMARVYAFHQDIDDQTRANADAPFNLDRDATEFVTRQLMMKRESLWINTYFKTGVWSFDIDGVTSSPGSNQLLRWDDEESTPLEDITDLKLQMTELTGYMPNVMVLGPRVLKALTHHPEILDRIKYTQRGQITLEMLASFFGVDKILVPYVVQNTAVEGATATYAFMYGKHVLLAYAAPSASLLQPSAGYTFSWTGYLGAGSAGNRIKRFRMEAIASDRVEGEMAFDMKKVSAELGIFIENIVTA